MQQSAAGRLTRAEAEDFLYFEAALLDEWRLKEWLADDAERIRQRVIRVLDPNCHAEAPRSRLRRSISNVRVLGQEGDLATVAANFICHRYRRHERIREYVGGLTYQLRITADGLKIRQRRIVIDAHELGSLGSVSFIL